MADRPYMGFKGGYNSSDADSMLSELYPAMATETGRMLKATKTGIGNWWDSLDDTSKVAAGLSVTPVGDIAGLANDARLFYQNPEMRTPANFGLSALGLLPLIPSMGMVKGVGKKMAGSIVPSMPTVPKEPEQLGMIADDVLSQGNKRIQEIEGLVPPVKRVAPQDEALRLAQERAALPVEQGGLGLPVDNTPEQRANIMFPNEGYHGSLYDINKFNQNKASTESHAGRGTYITDSPEDASINYANIYGPDVKAKVERNIERDIDSRNPIYRLLSRFENENLTPKQQEVLLANTINANNLGVVYPLRYRADKPIHLDLKNPRSSDAGPFFEYDKEYDDYIETAEAQELGKALKEYESSGGNSSYIHEMLADSTGESVPILDLYNAAKEGSGDMMDDYTGDIISGGVAASDFVKNFGVDQIAHTPKFSNKQLNLGTQHTVSMNPDNIRSRFAAFDPYRKSAAIAAAMGVAAPDLMADEKQKPAKKNIVPPVKKQGK